MATTRAATFSAKIRTLSDFHSRILNQQQIPSSAEMVTTLRYFQQTLVSFLKDIPSERSSLFEKYSNENALVRIGLYPNLNYSGLFYGIVNLLDAFPMISSAQTAIAEAILDTLKALYFFLDRECIEQLPLLLASQLGVFPSEVDRRLVHLLCDCIFPYSFGDGVNGRVSVPAVLILVLHHSVDNSLHTLIIERLAYHLPDLYSDLLTVIASGTSESRIAAVNLLFHYWPLLNPGIMLRRTVQYRVQAWTSPQCQNTQCVEKGPSTRLTYEPSICASLGDSAPPMFICHNCEESVTGSTTEPMPFLSQPLPLTISTTCQNKGCSSSSRIAIGTCFDEDCIRSHGYEPLRLCEECFNALHSIENNRAHEHIRHSGHAFVWGTHYERVMVEAIVKLLRETSSKLTELSADGESAKRPKWLRQLEGGRELGREIDPLSDERRMLSRFGIWLMVAHCPPVPEATPCSVGYLLGALFQWFSTTALLPNDAMGQTLEQLKADFGCEWLNQALSNHYEVFINELLPQQLEPLDGTIEDTIWDERFVRKEIMRDGLSKLLALAPYDIISIDTWSRVMPHWLHSLNTDLVSEDDLLELKVPISKLFEPDLCALPFEPQRLYEFLAIRLQSNSYEEILKALDWLHLLSRIDIRISLELLLEMFSNSLRQIPLPTSAELQIQQKEPQNGENESKAVDGLNSELASPESRETKNVEVEGVDNEEKSQQTLEGPMAAQLVMTDILAQQIKLAGGASAMTSESLLEHLFSLIATLLEYQPEEKFIENGWPHTCRDPEGDQFADCLRCQQALFLYQVLLQVLEQFCPKEESRLDALNYGDETARDFADWLSEASSSVHQQLPQGVVADGSSPRPSPSPRALSSSPAGHAFFGSPITQKRQQQPVQKTSTPLIKARQEVSTPSAEMVGALPTDDVDSASEQVAAFSFAEQSPLGMACVSATVIGGLLQQQEAILAGKNASEAVEGEDKRKIVKIEQKEEQRLFWETSVGRFRFSLEQLPAQLRLTFVLLTKIEREPDPDVQFFLLSMLKYLFLHRECLLNARKEQEHRGFLVWIQENLLIPRLWSLLRSDYSHVGQMATPLILHAITLPLGDDVFWESVNAEFTSSEWERRLKAVDRVLVLAHFVPPSAVRSNRTLLTSLSCAFSHLIVSVHDPNPAVAQKALLLLEALPRSSLTLICHCLEAQFDSCILDRPLIIARIHLLSVLLPEENLLSWDFFIQRFETLALEAHLKAQQNAGADASMHFLQDLLHSDPMSDVYQRKVTRARQSLNEADNVRSIVRSLRENSLRHQLNPGVRGDQVDLAHPLVQSTVSASSLSPRAIGPDSRYGRMREFTDEESNLCLLLNRVVDMQNPERHTVSLVVSLFVHFLASKRCGPADNAKKLSVLLRHFNTLLGYSNSEKCFTIPPARLRRAAVCNAFLHGLPSVLDSNLLIGNQLLSIVLQLLLYLPSPQKFASDAPSADYSLRLLSAQQRHNWLHSIIIILYKYRCDAAPTNDAIRKQMLIVVQTLEQQCHRCPPPSQNQEQQQPVPIASENKERRSATCLLEAPGPDGQWSSSTDDSEIGNDSGVEELITNDHVSAKIDLASNEPIKEKRFASVDEAETFKEHNGSGGSASKVSMQHRPESLRIMAIRDGGSPSDVSRNESTRTVSKGSDAAKTLDPRPPVIALHPPAGIRRSRRRPHSQKHQSSVRKNQKTNKPTRRGADFTRLSCSYCGTRLESFDEETLSLCCVALCTFLQRVPILAAPLLQRTLLCTARFIDTPQFPWHETNVFVPGNSKSAAKQLIRIILNQLSGSGIALQLFNLHIQADELYSFWSKIAQSLVDFTELNPVAFLQNLLEDIADGWPIRVTRILHNLATYIQNVPTEAVSNWASVVALIDGLYRRMHTQLISESTSNLAAASNAAQSVQNQLINNQQKQFRSEMTSSVLIMSRVLRVQGLATIKGAVQAIESFAKWLVEMLHKCPVELCDLLAVCTACNRGMIRERDKQILTRYVVAELLSALKFKCELAEENYLTIVRMVLQDFGEPLGDDWVNTTNSGGENEEGNESENNRKSSFSYWKNNSQQQTDQFNTGAAEAIRPHVPELLEFISDMHVLAKLKKQSASNSDRVGGDLKAGLAEVVALEMSRPSVRDSRTVMRFIPWLYSPPSLAQALPGQFAESVANVRVLSWILLGSLHARGVNGFSSNFQQIQQQQTNIANQSICLPVPIACSTQMADYINFVLAGFADQSKQSVVHMSALFHAFHLCQLWTIYCEQTATSSRSEEMVAKTMQQLLDFWARVTPAILQLLSHSKVLADMVNLHFINTLQALQQVNSAVLCQLYPMWEPVLTVHHAHVPRKLRLKFDSVEAQVPLENAQMRSWLSKVRYKISQIELQTSASSPFYNV